MLRGNVRRKENIIVIYKTKLITVQNSIMLLQTNATRHKITLLLCKTR